MIEKTQPKAGLALLVVLITDLANSLNIGKNMTDFQVAEAAVVILKEYEDFKIDDFAYCFMKAKTNKYGKTFDRLDLQIICQWLDMYAADKQEQVDYYWNSQKQDSDSCLLEDLSSSKNKNIDIFKSNIRKIIEGIDERKKSLREMKPSTAFIQTPEQILMNGYIKRFDKLYLIQRQDIKGGRFIKIDGRYMNVEDYLNFKAIVQPERVAKFLTKRNKKLKTN